MSEAKPDTPPVPEDAGGELRTSNPFEQMIERALIAARLDYTTDHDGTNPTHLDFHVPSLDIHLEVKTMHSDRVAEQMSRAPNVIVAQGVPAIRWLAGVITRSSSPTATPQDAEQRPGMIQCVKCRHWWLKFVWETGPTSFCRIPNCGCKCECDVASSSQDAEKAAETLVNNWREFLRSQVERDARLSLRNCVTSLLRSRGDSQDVEAQAEIERLTKWQDLCFELLSDIRQWTAPGSMTDTEAPRVLRAMLRERAELKEQARSEDKFASGVEAAATECERRIVTLKDVVIESGNEKDKSYVEGGIAALENVAEDLREIVVSTGESSGPSDSDRAEKGKTN